MLVEGRRWEDTYILVGLLTYTLIRVQGDDRRADRRHDRDSRGSTAHSHSRVCSQGESRQDVREKTTRVGWDGECDTKEKVRAYIPFMIEMTFGEVALARP